MVTESQNQEPTPAKFEVGERVQGAQRTIYVVKSRLWFKTMWTYACEREGEKKPALLNFPEKMLNKLEDPPIGVAIFSRP